MDDHRRPELSQAGRTILVAGGSTGIGYEISVAFAAAGADQVIIIARRPDVLSAAVKEIAEGYPRVKKRGIPTDFGDEAAVENLWADLARDNVFVDVLIPNAVAQVWPQDPRGLLGLGKQRVKEALGINVVAPFVCVELFYKQRERNASRKLVSLFPFGDEQAGLRH